jgi:hypothetical protein
VIDTRQRLGTGEAFATKVDFRLIPDFEPALLQGLVNVDLGPRAAHGKFEQQPLGIAHVVYRTGPLTRIVLILSHDLCSDPDDFAVDPWYLRGLKLWFFEISRLFAILQSGRFGKGRWDGD